MSRITASTVAASEWRRNSRRPTVTSQSTTPAAQMSVRRSTRASRICSGDMYATLPLSSPVAVRSDAWVSDRATPKSTIFEMPA
ncbi:MAG: hypothetical protein U0325_10755 [Polyangiales bacterium]